MKQSKIIQVIKGIMYAKICDGYNILANDPVFMCSREFGGCGKIYNIKNNTCFCRNCALKKGLKVIEN